MHKTTSYYINTGLACEHGFLDKQIDEMLRSYDFIVSKENTTLRCTPHYEEEDYHVHIDPLDKDARIEDIIAIKPAPKQNPGQKNELIKSETGAQILLLYFKIDVSYEHKDDPSKLE